MSTQLTVRGQTDIVRDGVFDLTPHSLSEAMALAEQMSKSALVPEGFKDRPADIMIAVQYGAEIGLKPLQALSSIAVINGRACVWGDGLLSLVLDSGLMTNYKEMKFDEIEAAGKAVFWCTRKGHPEPIQREFSIEDAKRAKLWGKVSRNGAPSPWVTYPWRMLQMRARSFALRDGFSDVLKGLSIREEVEDIEITEAPRVLAMPRRLSDRGSELPAPADQKQIEAPSPDEGQLTVPLCESCGKTMELRPSGEKNGHSWEPYYRCPEYTKGSQHSVIKEADWIASRKVPDEPGSNG